MENKEMTFEEFKQEVSTNIKAYLTDDYEDYKMEIKTINKAGHQYEGLLITPDKKSSCTPVLNLTKAYEDYNDGKPLDNILEELAHIRMTAVRKLPMNKEDLLEFDRVKDKIVPRLVNTENNQRYLKDKASISMEDLSIIFAVRTEEERGIADAVITNGLLEVWGVTVDDVHKQAIKNFETAEFKFDNLVDALIHRETPAIEDIDLDEFEVPVFILSNKCNTQGAGMVLNPYVMNRIIKKLGEVLIIPSSVEEVLVLPKENADIKDLMEIVTSVNDEQVAPEDRLSNNVYEYDTETGMLRIAK